MASDERELTAEDLSENRLAAALGGRPFRYYPALLSTEADALAWARSGAAHGAVVAAGYQASPRGRAGMPWELDFDRDLCFSIVLRPSLPPEREGWIYIAALAALVRALPDEPPIWWPDELADGEARRAAVGVQTGLGPAAIEWAVANVAVIAPDAERAPLLARVAAAFDAALEEPPEQLIAYYSERCATIGRRVRVRLTGVGPDVGSISGIARAIREDGALAIERDDDGRRLAVPPPYLRTIESEEPQP